MSTRTLLRLSRASNYHSNHSMQERDSKLALRKFKSKLKWKSARKILDVGCGPGDFTLNYLLPLLPQNGEMVAIDISSTMIQYANKNFGDPRLKFKVVDMTDEKFGRKYKDTFSIVVSFYCLHWIRNQKAVMKNIYDVLQPGGETLLVFLASAPIYLLFEIMSKKKKWAPYMHDYREVISPYYHSENAESDVRNIMKEIGFDVEVCSCKRMFYTMPSKEVTFETVQAVNPFVNQIPEHLQEEYDEELKYEMFSNKRLNTTVSSETGQVSFSYSLLTIYAKKPDEN